MQTNPSNHLFNQPLCNLTPNLATNPATSSATNLSEKPSYRQKPYSGRRVAPKLECPPPRYKRDWKKVLCFLPVYLPSGQNGCRICYSDDTWEDIPHRLEWVLEDWSHHHLTSIPDSMYSKRFIYNPHTKHFQKSLHQTTFSFKFFLPVKCIF